MSCEHPSVVVGVLVFNPEGKLLLVKSSRWFDFFVIPGGHVELGERLEVAAEREVFEEVGLKVGNISFLNIGQAINSPEFYKPKHFVAVHFTCLASDSNVRVDGREITDFVWIDPKEALGLNLATYVRNCINTFLAK